LHDRIKKANRIVRPGKIDFNVCQILMINEKQFSNSVQI
jgi:hypothetical protein